jgi:hypothetical protein
MLILLEPRTCQGALVCARLAAQSSKQHGEAKCEQELLLLKNALRATQVFPSPSPARSGFYEVKGARLFEHQFGNHC